MINFRLAAPSGRRRGPKRGVSHGRSATAHERIRRTAWSCRACAPQKLRAARAGANEYS
jgi:hypothetical protein